MQTKKSKGRPEPLRRLPCQLPYDASGGWSEKTTHAARQCVIQNLQRDLSWWAHRKRCKNARLADIDGTLCRLRNIEQSVWTAVLTNIMLLRNVNGKLSAMILNDPSDERGPMSHWPGRSVAALQQLSLVQQLIDDGLRPPLPNFTAILNLHDHPRQFARFNWCGLVPVLSNSRVSGEHRDLMMPDFSFAPFSYLTNIIDANLSSSLSVPRGWPEERMAIYQAGRKIPYPQKRRSLFWRGGETHPQRKVYANAIESKDVHLPADITADVVLCGSHCSLKVGVPPEAWCDKKLLLSLPGRSFAVGFKYTLLCSSFVVRGGYTEHCEGRRCPRFYEQFWHAGLNESEHFTSSWRVEDLPKAVDAADKRADAALVAARSGDYAYHMLDPGFITEYWYRLLQGYAELFDWELTESVALSEVCAWPHRQTPINPSEQVCYQGRLDKCSPNMLGFSSKGFVQIPTSDKIAVACKTTSGMQHLYSQFTRVIPKRMAGFGNTSAATTDAREG